MGSTVLRGSVAEPPPAPPAAAGFRDVPFAGAFGSLLAMGEPLDGEPLEGAPVLLTHGAFSDRRALARPAAYLRETGRPVYAIEWRARRAASGTSALRLDRGAAFDFDAIATGELEHALAAVHAWHGKPVHLVAHSGGGLACALLLALRPALAARVASLTAVASQATVGRAQATNAALVASAERVGRVLSVWPGRWTGMGPVDEGAALMSQWVRWTAAGRFTTRDGRPVPPLLAATPVRCFAVAGAADWIAPPAGCAALAALFAAGSEHRTFGRASGLAQDLDHARVWQSRPAFAAVWPAIAEWIARNDG